MSALLKLSIAKKLWLLTVLSALGIVALTCLFLASERNMLLEERQDRVREAVEVAHGVLVHYQSLAAKGEMEDSAARQAAVTQIKSLRYSGSEYFWINDMQAHMVAQRIADTHRAPF